MAIYNQIASLPIIFQIGNNIVYDLEEIISSKNLLFHKILILSGETFSQKLASQISIGGVVLREIVYDNTFAEVDRINKLLINKDIDLIIGIGGGKVLDLIKRVSFLQKINHISIPTIISNDGLISPICVLKNEEGKSESLAGYMPFGVIIDLEIIINSPTKFIQAAAGDILSNMSATNDWLFASKKTNEKINDIAFQFSRMSAHASVNFERIDLNSKDFIKMIIQGQVNSGIAMGLSGNSRPCSGSEHLISHAIDFLKLSNNQLHGYQVGVISLFCLYLQNDLSDKIVNYSRKISLNQDISSTCIDFEYNFKEILKISRSMRPGRLTILDYHSDNKIYDIYLRYKDYYEI
jgi:glycerol-1-phosphate dehydrogenase [NAD(P)+]